MNDSDLEMVSEYITLFPEFLNGKTKIYDFAEVFFKKFQREKRRNYSKSIYDVLNEFQGDCDCLTDDEESIQNNPAFNISEAQFLEKAKLTHQRLLNLLNSN